MKKIIIRRLLSGALAATMLINSGSALALGSLTNQNGNTDNNIVMQNQEKSKTESLENLLLTSAESTELKSATDLQDGKIESAFSLEKGVDPKEIRFNNQEWSGKDISDVTVNPGKQSQVYEINREKAHSVLIPYQSTAAARTGAEQYEKEKSEYYLSLTTNEDIDPLTSAWSFKIVESPSHTEYNDFYKTDYSADDWPGIAVPSSWQVQGIGEDGTPYTGYYDPEYGYDPPYYSNNSPMPSTLTVNDEEKNIFNGLSIPAAPTEYNPVGYYRRYFNVPGEWITDKNKVFITFNGVESAYYVYCNGYEVGYHEDGRTPAEFDLTPFLNEDGKDNLLAVKVYRWADCSWMDDQDALRLSGIFRDVYLMATPAVHIRDYKVETDLDDDYESAKLTIDVWAHTYSNDLKLEDYAVVAQLYNGDQDVFETYDPKDITVTFSESSDDTNEVSASVTIPVKNPDLWFPDNPNLYTLVLSLYDQSTGTAIEHISQQLGFREITFRSEEDPDVPDLIRINGKKLMMYGVNRVESSPDGGHYVSPELCEKEVQILKQNNINTIRTSHCPPDTYLCYLADNYGLMLIYEANNESHAERKNSISEDNFYDLALSRVLNAVEWEKNRTSNIMWSLGNESGAQTNWLKIIAQLRKVDTTRPVHYEGITGNGRSGSLNPKWKEPTEDAVYPDVQSSMYSYPDSTSSALANYMGKFSSELTTSAIRSVMLCEFSHSNTNGLGALSDYTDMFRGYERSIGGCIWDFVDQSIWTKPIGDVSSEQFLNEDGCYLGYGTGNGTTTGVSGTDWGEAIQDGNGCADGIVTATRVPQPEMAEVKKLYQVINFTADDDELLRGIISVRNEAYSINANAYDYKWTLTENGKVIESGTAKAPNLSARSSSEDVLIDLKTKAVSVPYTLPETLRPGAEYFLTIQACLKNDTNWANEGYVVAEEQFKLPLTTNTNVDSVKINSRKKLQIDDNNDVLTIFNDDFSISFENGIISNYVVNGKTLLTQGPVPAFWRVLQKGDTQGGAVNTIGKSEWKEVELPTPEVSEPEYLDDGSIQVATTYTISLTADCTSTVKMEYTIYVNGAVQVTTSMSDQSKKDITRFGVDMVMPGEYENIEWLTRGPEDNFSDRTAGYPIGLYKTTVSDNLFSDFINPTLEGYHQETRWMALSGADTDVNLLIVSDASNENELEANALHYAYEDLAVRHFYQLEDQNKTVVSLNGYSRGVGGGLIGVMDKYALKSGDLNFSFTMVPYESSESDLQTLADSYRYGTPTFELSCIPVHLKRMITNIFSR